MIEAAAGMFVYVLIFAENGFRISRLINIRNEWESKAINDLQDDYGQGKIKGS